MAYYITENAEKDANSHTHFPIYNFRNPEYLSEDTPKLKYPSFVDQVHGLSLALFAKSRKVKIFWWLVFVACAGCGMLTTILVIIEYIQEPTAISITIKLVPAFELPATTICLHIPDALNYEPLFNDIQHRLPAITNDTALDLISFWLGGSGLRNIWRLETFNQSYLNQLDQMYRVWSKGYDTQSFYHQIQENYGYKCEQLFLKCVMSERTRDCCTEVFRPVWVIQQGLCFQTRRNLNQTETNGVGALSIEMKGPPSVTTSTPHSIQPALYIYINDNFGHVIPVPRFQIFPGNTNFLHLRARLIELLKHSTDCTHEIVGQDASCFVHNWLSTHVLDTFNCTVPYLRNVPGIPADTKICDPATIANNYSDTVNTANIRANKKCVPGCTNWDYNMWLETRATQDKNRIFYFVIGYDDLHFEHIKEISTISISGLISQVGGQLGLYLGLSIVTLLQILIYCVRTVVCFLYHILKPLSVEPEADQKEKQRVVNRAMDRGSDVSSYV